MLVSLQMPLGDIPRPPSGGRTLMMMSKKPPEAVELQGANQSPGLCEINAAVAPPRTSCGPLEFRWALEFSPKLSKARLEIGLVQGSTLQVVERSWHRS